MTARLLVNHWGVVRNARSFVASILASVFLELHARGRMLPLDEGSHGGRVLQLLLLLHAVALHGAKAWDWLASREVLLHYLLIMIVDDLWLRHFARLFLLSLALFLAFIVDLGATPRSQTYWIVEGVVCWHATGVIIETLWVAISGWIPIINTVLVGVYALGEAVFTATILLLRIVVLKLTMKHD